MKTINVPLVGNCPQWVEDIPPGRDAEFKALVGQVRQRVLLSAAQGLITEGEHRIWHSTLFRDFVPLDYYAGNHRGVDRSHRCLEVDVNVGGISGSSYHWVRFDIQVTFENALQQLTALELGWSQMSAADRVIALATVIGNIVGTFIRIHPFINGNGRISRLLWQWYLARFGVPSQYWVHPRPGQPYSNLMRDAMSGDFRPLIMNILKHLNVKSPEQN